MRYILLVWIQKYTPPTETTAKTLLLTNSFWVVGNKRNTSCHFPLCSFIKAPTFLLSSNTSLSSNIWLTKLILCWIWQEKTISGLWYSQLPGCWITEPAAAAQVWVDEKEAAREPHSCLSLSMLRRPPHMKLGNLTKPVAKLNCSPFISTCEQKTQIADLNQTCIVVTSGIICQIYYWLNL